MTSYGPEQRVIDLFKAEGFNDTDAYRHAQSGISVYDAVWQRNMDRGLQDQKEKTEALLIRTPEAPPSSVDAHDVPSESFMSRLGWLVKWTLILVVIGTVGFYLLPLLFGNYPR